MDDLLLKDKIQTCVNEYINFMKIKRFPDFSIKTKEVSLQLADSQGFDSIAQAIYDVKTAQHTLVISTNLPFLEYVVFHEFTHILDSYSYTDGDKIRHFGISGYMEYHASQVELLKLLGATDINNIPSFTMNTMIETICGNKTVGEYIQEKLQHAIGLFGREDFPANIETLATAIGVLFNYWGLRSICEIYSTDYIDTAEYSAFLKYIPTMQFVCLNKLMMGWLDRTKIELSINAYVNTVYSIIREYRLT